MTAATKGGPTPSSGKNNLFVMSSPSRDAHPGLRASGRISVEVGGARDTTEPVSVRPYRVHKSRILRHQYPGHRFPYLHTELKYQRPMVAQTVSFLELPYELRVMIYRHVLVLDEPIELWAETGDVYLNQRQNRVNAAKLRQAFKRSGVSNLGFLRLSKLINLEAAEIFYGENKFRFSGKNDHMVAYAYIQKIGKRNLDRIKTMSIAAPFPSTNRGMYGENWNPSCWIRVHEIYNRMAFPFPGNTWYNKKRYPRLDFDHAWRMLAWQLTTADSLEDLNIVLTSAGSNFYYAKDCEMAWSAFDDLITAKPSIEIHATLLVNPTSNATKLGDSFSNIIGRLKKLAVCRVHLGGFGADEDGPNSRWEKIGQPYVDKRGRIVSDVALDRSVEVVDVLPDMERMFDGKW